MLARMRKSMDDKEQGFTLIELLVVMIIIGILAAIAVPVFLNQRKKAVDTAAKSDVSILGKEITTYMVDSTVPPVLEISGSVYQYKAVGAQPVSKIGRVSDKMTSITQKGTSDTDWCVQVNYPTGGTATAASYSAASGLALTPCA